MEKIYGDIYTVAEVQKILKISKSTVYVLIKEKKLGAIKIRSTYRVTKDDLLLFIKENSLNHEN